MTLPIWPTSPVPATLQREPIWAQSNQQYDSGLSQGSTAFVKPLIRYGLSLTNVPRSKQSSLHAFYNVTKAGVIPFLFKDPYDYLVGNTICVQTGTAARSFFVRTSEGYPVIPQSGALLITSNLSGALTQGTHYSFNQATGVFSTHIVPSSGDFWTASCEYFRKCKFTGYTENSKIWELFDGNVSWQEIALP